MAEPDIAAQLKIAKVKLKDSKDVLDGLAKAT
jgi:hypothetical protein